jgi:hypothetical protein
MVTNSIVKIGVITKINFKSVIRFQHGQIYKICVITCHFSSAIQQYFRKLVQHSV